MRKHARIHYSDTYYHHTCVVHVHISDPDKKRYECFPFLGPFFTGRRALATLPPSPSLLGSLGQYSTTGTRVLGLELKAQYCLFMSRYHTDTINSLMMGTLY